ncbi:MAG: riboflavin synthase, partial [Calditrichota bacterium]
MFTGIIEEVGEIISVKSSTNQNEISVRADLVMEDLKVADSISVDGVCQTVVSKTNQEFTFQAVGETLTKTTMGEFRKGRQVNLERSLKLNSRLHGHFVQGHINGTGSISSILKRGDNFYFELIIPENLAKYCAPEGAIAIDGISLTIANIDQTRIGLNIIPFTFHHTTLYQKKV